MHAHYEDDGKPCLRKSPSDHLKCVHPLMELGNDDGDGVLHGYAVKCEVAPSKTIRFQKFDFQFLSNHDPRR